MSVLLITLSFVWFFFVVWALTSSCHSSGFSGGLHINDVIIISFVEVSKQHWIWDSRYLWAIDSSRKRKKSDWGTDLTKPGPILPVRISKLTSLGPKRPSLVTFTSLSHWMGAVLGSSWKCWLREMSADGLCYSQAVWGWHICFHHYS